MAMVFQNYALYPDMTVFENIGFSLKLRRRPAAEISRRVTDVAEMLDIGHLLQRKPAQLSGGQQQRVALGRALVKQPLVFLLDEPFSNLDASLRARMRTEVKHLHLALGTTSVFVTHDQEEAMTLSDVICVMRDGKIIQSGSPTEIYAKPRNIYVADFVGKPKMSLIEGSLERGADGVTFVGAAARIELGRAADLGLVDGSWPIVVLGVRAEDVTVHVGGPVAGRATFGATVGLTEPIGSDTFVELDIGADTLVARVDPDLSISLGQSVAAELRPTAIHLFDRESGDRIVA
jgi:ABC-type sugar transport system ATPase subunit